MVRRYADLIEVRRRDAVPSEFTWHGRVYRVRDVQAHWVESGGWWQAAARGSTAVARSGGELDGGLLDGEREFWRVEAGGRAGSVGAGAGGSTGSGVYDLCFDWVRGAWSLARALD